MKNIGILFLSILMGLCAVPAATAAQGRIKIATVSVQKILAESKAGREAQQRLQAKADAYRTKFQKEQQEVQALRNEIQSKSSVWSDAVRSEKQGEYQEKARDLQLKTQDARYDLQQLEKQAMGPILKKLEGILADYGKKHGYTLILENSRQGVMSATGILYAAPKLDITNQVLKEMNEKGAK